MHYYQFNIGDYRKDTGHLTLLEHAIYRHLLDSYYLNEKPIETQRVIRRLRLVSQNELDALDAVLNDFFKPSECGKFWNHKRCDTEIAQYQARAETARVNGSKGGRPKKPKKTQRVNSANPEKPSQKLTNNHKPITNKEKGKGFSKPTPSQVSDYASEKSLDVDGDSFCDFYSSKGWKVGSQPMKDWKAAARQWHRRNQTGDKPEDKPWN